MQTSNIVYTFEPIQKLVREQVRKPLVDIRAVGQFIYILFIYLFKKKPMGPMWGHGPLRHSLGNMPGFQSASESEI